MENQTAMFPVKGKSIGFSRKEFKAGQNFTVRVGKDWAKERDLRIGSIISLTDPERETFYAEARITHIMVCELKDITKDVISKNHNSHMREGIGLVLGLQKYYKKQLHGGDMVNCVGFEPVQIPGGGNPS